MGQVSDEQGERFHSDILQMGQRYKGRWDAAMMSEYCWSLKRDAPGVKYARKCYVNHF